jgi:hypothetical protein
MLLFSLYLRTYKDSNLTFCLNKYMLLQHVHSAHFVNVGGALVLAMLASEGAINVLLGVALRINRT